MNETSYGLKLKLIYFDHLIYNLTLINIVKIIC
jgi:hypothetical protein